MSKFFKYLERIFKTHFSSIWRWLLKAWYDYISKKDIESEVVFMNFGYTDNDVEKLSLSRSDERNRQQIQLYYCIARFANITDKDILEVGSGRGGGADFLTRTFRPNKYIGLDLCKSAVDFSNMYFYTSGLSFIHGNAIDIPFGDESFDVVINIESSHAYSDMDKFLSEVKRVLRRRGFALFADFRTGDDRIRLVNEIKKSGLVTLKEIDLTDGIVEAIELDNDRRLKLIEKLIPNLLHSFAKKFAAVKDSDMYSALAEHKTSYLFFILQKQ